MASASAQVRGEAAAPTRSQHALTLGDQALSSATNLLVGVAIARAIAPDSFGVFGLIYGCYAILLTACRSGLGDALLITESSSSVTWARRQGQSMVGAALAVGLAAGLIAAGLGLFLRGTGSSAYSASLLIFGVGLPALMAQDAWRYVFFTSRQPGRAIAIDGAWAALQLLLFLALGRGESLSVYLGVWVGTAAAAAALGTVLGGGLPRLDLAWTKRASSLGAGLAGSTLLQVGGIQAVTFILAATHGLVASAAMRGAELIYGPVRVLAIGIVITSTVTGARRYEIAGRDDRQFAVGLSLVLVVITVVWALIVVVLPGAIGEWVLGDTWHSTSEITAVYSGWMIAFAAGVGATVGLRVSRRIAPIWRIAVVTTSVLLGAVTLASLLGGLSEAILAMAGAVTLASALLWAAYLRIRWVAGSPHNSEKAR